MLKEIKLQAKTEKEALELASERLYLSTSKLKAEMIKDDTELEKGNQLYLITPNIDLTTEGKQYLEGILQGLNIESKMEIRSPNPNEIYYSVKTKENALLIGREGKTLLAFQTLLRNHLSSFTSENILVSLDIGNYHRNRKRQLEILATKNAKEVASTLIAIKLEPMNSFDRRIIHEKLSDWRDVETVSEGEGDDRAIVIKPKNR
ncbi:MAG: R3H domain-containing nucleic acid-binding protein [Acholeplasmataceae bacterium]